MSTTTETELTAGPWDVSNAAYHADRECISHTGLELFRNRPDKYYRIYVCGEEDPADQVDREWKRIGPAVHALICEPEDFEDQFAINPGIRRDKRTKKYQEWLEEVGDRIELTRDDFLRANAMANEVRAHPLARLLVNAAIETEASYRWPEYGVWCKVRPDIHGEDYFADVKSCADVTDHGLRTQFGALGRHRQAAFYQLGLSEITGIVKRLYWIIVENVWPYRVRVAEPSADALAAGYNQNAVDLSNLAHCRASGIWEAPEHSAWIMDLHKWHLQD